MFMLVHLSDNNKIVINMGQDVTQANDLVKMFEQNAKFLNAGYSETTMLQPKISIELGTEIEFKGYGDQNASLLIKSDDVAPSLGFVLATNEAFIDVAALKSAQKAALEKKQQEIKQLEAKLQIANHRVEVLEGQLVPTNN